MISKDNITEFFEKYKRNIEQEQALNDSLLKAEDQEGWIDNLRAKSKVLRMIYIENEAMLNLYLRPFLEQKSRLTPEIADEFRRQLQSLCEQGYCDRLVCIRMAEVLQNYYKENGERDKWIKVTHMLGNFYSRYSDREDAERSLVCFDMERREFQRYFQIDSWSIRRRILFSFYNYAIVMVNNRDEFMVGEPDGNIFQTALLRQVDRAMAVYDHPDVRALDGDKYDLDDLKEELSYDVYGNWLCGSEKKEDLSPQMLERSTAVIEKIYQDKLSQCDNPYEMLDEIYCNYWKALFYTDRIGIYEYIQRVKDYCDYTLEHDQMDPEENFEDSRYFQVNMYQIPNLVTAKGLREHKQLYEEVKEYALSHFKKFVEELPRTKNAVFINGPLKQSLLTLATHLGTDNIDIHFFLSILINRDEISTIHVSMVKRLAMALLRKAFEKNPALMVGMMGTKDVVDVLEKREEFEKLLGEAALLYDIGKADFADLIALQSRRLEECEHERIHRHPRIGYEILKQVKYDDIICDVALGHHKSYDGRSGYPDGFDNTASPARFYIDLIKICDCMDAATDQIGRIYNKAKSMQEFVDELGLGAGYLYNPDIVELIQNDRELFEELEYICSAGRISVYYETYHMFLSTPEYDKTEKTRTLEVKGEDEERQASLLEDIQELGQERTQVLAALAKSTLLLARICLDTDKIQFIYNADSYLLRNIKEGSFRDFINGFNSNQIHPEDYLKMNRLVDYGTFSERLYASNGNFEMELRLKGEHDWHWIRAQFITAELKGGAPKILVLAISDIDSNKRQRLQLQEAIVAAHKKAESASKAKSEFLSNMSHDIRTPMNAIIGMTQIAQKHIDDTEKVRDCMNKIEQASTHLLELINEVLDMSKIESGKMELDEKPVSLKNLLKDIMEMTQGSVNEKNIERVIDMDRLPQEMVYGDTVRISEIVLNLMSNAVKYTPEGKWIHFTAEKLDEVVKGSQTYRIVVRDGGIGMSREFLKKLFTPFSREYTEAVNKMRGTGLGLAITKELVEMMNGSIQVSSTKGEGSAFEVILRLRPAEYEEQPTSDKRKLTIEDCWNRFKNNRVLIVEDNDLNREIFEELLADTGVKMEEAYNGREAVEQIRNHEEGYYDMVFMDIQMPIMNGYDASRAIRQYEDKYSIKHRVPIIALTADVFTQDYNQAINAGMDGHLGKPVILSQVLDIMVQWLEDKAK